MKKLHVGSKIALSSLVGLACLWLAARSVSWSEVGAALERFDFAWLAVAIAISLTIQLLRALRWQVELSPLARLPYPMVWQVIAVAYMMINVLPFSMGEPVRPLLMSWRSKLPVSAIVGNWVFEKMMDTAAIVVFVHLALLTADLLPLPKIRLPRLGRRRHRRTCWCTPSSGSDPARLLGQSGPRARARHRPCCLLSCSCWSRC